MYLLRAALERVPPFGTIELPFADDDGRARLLTVVHASGGAGKTVLLSVLGATRPGHATALFGGASGGAASATCEWHLGGDDVERPHPLPIATPSAMGPRPGDDEAIARGRREQAHFERKAKDGGFVFLTFPTNRWFSRQPMALHAPGRTVAHYDVRTTVNLDDPQRADLTRDTKMALCYAALAAAAARDASVFSISDRPTLDPRVLGDAMRTVVDTLVQLAGFTYLGLDAVSLEPVFGSAGQRRMPFDALPTRARHLVAIAALSVRTLWAAYPGTDPRAAEGVVAVDDIDLYQDPAVQIAIGQALRAALPAVQWILTTSSTIVASACDQSEILSLRRLPGDDRVELFVDAAARTH